MRGSDAVQGKRDREWIVAGASLRATAVGLSGVVLGLHLAQMGLDAARIGALVTVGLAGAACGTWAALYGAERLGRRRSLVLLALLMAGGGIAFAWTERWEAMLVAAFFGAMNGMGRDRSAGVTLDQTMLPQRTTAVRRTVTFAWYNVGTDAGHALGALLAGLPALLRAHAGLAVLPSFRCTWVLYAGLCVLAAGAATRLSPAVEAERGAPRAVLSPPARRIVGRFAAISALDSLGGGFLTSALVGYWFFRRFGIDESVLGPLFAAARVANGVSHLGAAWLAGRIGLVNTMVWTHLPSSLLLATVPFAPSLGIAMALFLAREALVEMDVPTRQSYLAAVVAEHERLPAAAITNLTRAVSWAVAPAIAGFAMRNVALGVPLVAGPALKIAYDLMLYRAFRHLRPPEEARPRTGA
jgi:MFS family permease